MIKQPHEPFRILFLGHDNTTDSRLAATYMTSLLDKKHYIVGYNSTGAHMSHTTKNMLTVADVIIFMNKHAYNEAERVYDFDIRKSLVWHIPSSSIASERLPVHAPTGAHQTIRRHCEKLRDYLTQAPWVDVVDNANKPTDLRLPLAWVTDRGLWHRGIYVIVRTHDGKFVVAKRSQSIIFAPGMLEISLGGGVDIGENPRRTAQRETYEELGIYAHEKDFQPLFIWRQVGYHPRYNKQTKAHIYAYAVTLPEDISKFTPQLEEVAEIRILSKRQVLHLLRTHRMKHFGQLAWGYKMYQKAIALSTAL